MWWALATPDHFHHQLALNYWEQQAAEQVHFCTVTALGLVRLLSQPKPVGPAVETTHEASALLQSLCQQPGVSLAIPATDGWEVFHKLMREGDLSARLCTDAYLAALAISNGWRLVSFHHDFERFGGLQRLSVSSGGSSGQPTLIQLSKGLKFRILMQQRCPAQKSRCSDPGISNGMRRMKPRNGSTTASPRATESNNER